jgi:hypothetical protein
MDPNIPFFPWHPHFWTGPCSVWLLGRPKNWSLRGVVGCVEKKIEHHLAVCQNLVPLVNIKIAGKWMFIPLKMVLIGIDQ